MSTNQKVCPVCGCRFRFVRATHVCCSGRCSRKGKKRRDRGQPENNKLWRAWWSTRNDRADGLKTCSKCGQDKPADPDHFFKEHSGRNLMASCRVCHNKASAGRHHAIRRRVLEHYSSGNPECACCGESRYEFLCLDHTNGGGNKQRRELGMMQAGQVFHRWIVRNNFPAGYRVLCHNCNMALGFYGACPHDREREERKVDHVQA